MRWHIQKRAAIAVVAACAGTTVLAANEHLRLAVDGTGGAFIAFPGQPSGWVLSGVADGTLPSDLTLTDVDGQPVAKAAPQKDAAGFRYNLSGLPVGFYRAKLTVSPSNSSSEAIERPLAVIQKASGTDSRFGVDAALSRFGGDDRQVDLAIRLLKAAGVGSVRDRLNWSSVQPSASEVRWGRFLEVARNVNAAGLEQTTVFHDSPAWVRPSDGSQSGDRRAPQDYAAVRAFGAAFGRDMGRYIGAVEFWNEENSDFFSGTPWQYANGLRAFSAGVRSQNPAVKLLIGASAGDPGPFFDGVGANGVGDWFDIWNQHYYDNPNDFLRFKRQKLDSLAGVGLTDKPGWITETGMGVRGSSAQERAASERDQASHLIRAFVMGFAAGYERVFYFFLRELVEEGRNNWGILNSDFSPRPSYVALSNIIVQLRGRPFAGYVERGGSFVAYFGDAGQGYVAVAWGSARQREDGLKAVDMFGRPITQSYGRSDPIFLIGIKGLPEGVTTIHGENAKVRRALPPLLFTVDLADQQDQRAKVTEHAVEVPVNSGGVAKVAVSMTSLDNSASRSAQVSCDSSDGIEARVSPPRQTFTKDRSSATVECEYNVSLRPGARGVLKPIVVTDGWSSAAQIRVVATPERRKVVASRSLLQQQDKTELCAGWRARSSPTVRSDLAIAGGCSSTFSVRSTVVSPGDGWVFPIADMPPGAANLVGLEFESSPVQGQPYPRKPLMMQLVDSKGGIWVLPLDTVRQQDGSFTHEATFARAMVAPWSKVKSNEPLDTASIKQISIGYAGGGTKPGDVVAFKVTGLRGVEGR